METIRKNDNQSLFDLSIQHLGSAEAAILFAIQNNISLTDAIEPGTALQAPAIQNKNIATYYANKNITPATYGIVVGTSTNAGISVNYVPVAPFNDKTTAIVADQQSLFDIAIQYCGSVEAAIHLAILNNMPITDDLETGREITLSETVSDDIAVYYKNRNIVPATAIVTRSQSDDNPVVTQSGIGYMAIAIDFIIS